MCTWLRHCAITCRCPSFEPTKCAHLIRPEQIASARCEMICQSSWNISVGIQAWDVGQPRLVKENVGRVCDFRPPTVRHIVEIPHGERLWMIPVLNCRLEVPQPGRASHVIGGSNKPAVPSRKVSIGL